MNLFRPREYARFAGRREKIMQPSCRTRLLAARDILFAGLLRKGKPDTEAGLYHMTPLMKCSMENFHLPCAKACSQELYIATMPLQLSSSERTREITKQSSVAEPSR
jgi:hypothetical protein